MKTLDKLNADLRVESAWSEQDSGDGYWVALKTGFADLKHDPFIPTHTIHEWKIKDVLTRMKGVKPCNCKPCKEYTLTPNGKH